MSKLSVIVPFHNNHTGLAVTLVQLQSQLIPPDKIIVIDTSKDKSGLAIAERYAEPGTKVVVEVSKATIYEAWNKGIDLSYGSDCLILNDDLIIPQNFIQVLGLARGEINGLVYVPHTPPREHAKPYITSEFYWYAEVDLMPTIANWIPGFCFLLTKECIEAVGLFDEGFKVWFGDDDYQARVLDYGDTKLDLNPIVRLDNCFVYHYGNTSYNYQDKKTKALIAKDLKRYRDKYESTKA